MSSKYGRGAGYEKYTGYDYIRLTQQSGQGTPVVFEEINDGYQDTYHIRMTECNYSGYNYFSCSGEGWIYLDQKKNASVFNISYSGDTGIDIRIKGSAGGGYLKAHSGKGRTWLLSDRQYNVGDLYTLIPAE